MTNYVDTETLCKLYGVSKQAVAKWRKEKGLPHEKLSYRCVRYDLDEVKAFFKENARKDIRR